ncbi:hypothetical protein BE17_18135 [Sorangium cellulosum]|uniref:Uncharacterized protein n=1 Tax=Sorangium cellulosum TaxID=56 RepID=A0A150QQJ8_SORCE|nr:hypothetical protein BE17_18135 [Sorangium cellulosum]
MQLAAAELVCARLCSRPFVRMLYESSGYWIREGISYLFHQSISCRQMHHAGCPRGPHRTLPSAQNLGSERDKAMKLLKKAWELASGIGNDEMKVCGHHAERVH